MKIALAVLLPLLVGACAAVVIDDPGAKAGGSSVLVCHKGKQTLDLPPEAAKAHLNHGDSRGPC